MGLICKYQKAWWSLAEAIKVRQYMVDTRQGDIYSLFIAWFLCMFLRYYCTIEIGEGGHVFCW